MPDISMCQDTKCKKSETCYRFRAYPNERQSFFCGSPREGEDCEMHWSTDGYDDSRLKPMRDILRDYGKGKKK